jgi:hypothetical protein
MEALYDFARMRRVAERLHRGYHEAESLATDAVGESSVEGLREASAIFRLLLDVASHHKDNDAVSGDRSSRR